MSLAIEVDYVTGVLLRDGWHEVVDGSFRIDAYEYIHRDRPERMLNPDDILVGGGRIPGVSSTGAAWSEAGGTCVACPVPSILAVKYRYPVERT
jgi:hypothetical protein